ncbi:MAG TPA: hypothetical protein VGM99_03915, partial [Candidatus Cybelea sp.]
GVAVTFYQSQPQKTAPKLEILDAQGRVIRSVSGTHKIAGKDEPYIPNKAGLNRYVWDFAVNGPVKWNGGSEFSKGPDTGPGVVPGSYSARMTLSGRTYVQSFSVGPDPRSRFTQADYRRSFDEAMRQMAHLSAVDTMLNNLDDVKKGIETALEASKKANNAALTAKLQEASTARQALFDTLAVNMRGEGTEDEGRLHDDVFGAYFAAQGLITPAVSSLLARADAEYRDGVNRYNAFLNAVLPGVNAALKQAGMKALPAAGVVKI